MKLKLYGWLSLDFDDPRDSRFHEFAILPAADVHVDTTRMKSEDISDWWPHGDYHGLSIFIIFRWLIFGFTIDMRFKDDARREVEAK